MNFLKSVNFSNHILEKSNKNYQKKLGLAVRDDALKICDAPKFSTVYVVKCSA